MFFWHIIRWIQLAAVATYWYIRNSRSEFYRLFLQHLRHENILFTKIFQALANTSSIDLDIDLRSELRPYTMNASYTEAEINYAAIDEVEELYGVRMDRHVANSGMIALVFNGTDVSGNPVVLKLKRTDISNRLHEGCDNVRQFYQWATYFFPKNIIVRALRPFFHNLDDILEQCDFSRELQNMIQAREDYAELGFIHIPAVRNTTTADTGYILMDSIPGTHSPAPDTSEEDRLILLFKFCMFITFGYVSNAIQHTDLHTGNVIFMANGDLGIIDFGLAVRFTDDEHEVLLSLGEIIRGAQKIEDIDLIDTFKDIFLPPIRPEEITDQAAFIEQFKAILQPIVDYVDADELNLIDNIDRMGSLLNREMIMTPNFYKLILAMMSMGQLYSIMGHNYVNPELIRSIEMRALNHTFQMIM